MHLNKLQRSDSLEGIARLGAVFFQHVSNGPTSNDLLRRRNDMATEIRMTIGERPLSELEPVRQTRKLYHALGIDPTKDRPSSERLLKRVVQGRELPTVNQLVDAVNLVSLTVQTPLGVYDWDKIAPPVLVRIGRPDESFTTIGGKRFQAGGRIVLVDGESVFGSPSRDSERSKVGEGTVRALSIVWAPAGVSNDWLESVLKEVIQAAKDFCGARVAQSGILG